METPGRGKGVSRSADGNWLMMPSFDVNSYTSLLDSEPRAKAGAKATPKPAASSDTTSGSKGRDNKKRRATLKQFHKYWFMCLYNAPVYNKKRHDIQP